MSFTKENLLNLKVYDAQANYLGHVKDIAFTVGQETLSLVVGKDDKQKEQDQMIGWKSIQAVGQIIILKAPEPEPKPTGPAQQTAVCPSCGNTLTWVAQYNRWYCTKEKKYA